MVNVHTQVMLRGNPREKGTDRQTDMHTDRQTHTHTHIHTRTHTNTHTHKHAHTHFLVLEESTFSPVLGVNDDWLPDR